MSKPPIGAEPWMKTPTLNVDPTETGPMLGGLTGHEVAVADVVTQTNPGAEAAWRFGISFGNMRSELTKTSMTVIATRRFKDNQPAYAALQLH